MFFQNLPNITSSLLPWYFRNIRVDKGFLSFFNHALLKFKFRQVSPDFSFECDLLKRAPPQAWFTLLASRLSKDPRTLLPHPHHQQQVLLAAPQAWVTLLASRLSHDPPHPSSSRPPPAARVAGRATSLSYSVGQPTVTRSAAPFLLAPTTSSKGCWPRHKPELLCWPADRQDPPHPSSSGCWAEGPRHEFAEWAEGTLNWPCERL